MTHDPSQGNNRDQSTDPIFRAIEQHREALMALNEAVRVLDGLETSLPFDVRRAPRVQAGVVKAWDGSADPTWLYSEDEIDRHLERWRGVWPDHVLTARAIELRAALAADAALLADVQARAGLTAARAACDQACTAEDLALQRLTRTMPTTGAGASAFAQYIVSHLDETEGSPAWDEVNTATLATLERALTALAHAG